MSCCCVQVGISLVGLSSVLHGGGSTQVEVSPEQMLLGMGLIVASQVDLAPNVMLTCMNLMSPLTTLGTHGVVMSQAGSPTGHHSPI